VKWCRCCQREPEVSQFGAVQNPFWEESHTSKVVLQAKQSNLNPVIIRSERKDNEASTYDDGVPPLYQPNTGLVAFFHIVDNIYQAV
jgi:hypothetical protein